MFLEWYSFLSAFYARISGPLMDASGAVPLPVLGAIFLGLLGSTSPCQLTGNAGAMAYVGQRIDDRRYVLLALLAFILGKVLIYTVLGGALLLLGREITMDFIPMVKLVRRALGPLFLVLGLWLLGVLRSASIPAVSVSLKVQWRLAGLGVPGAFLLGVLLSLAFCPTMFLLFFGLVLPLGLGTGQGFLVPGFFAVGTSIPLLAFSGLVVLGGGGRDTFVRGTRRLDRVARRVAGVVLVAVGLNDTFLYWFL